MEMIDYLRKMLNIQRLSGTFKFRSYNLAEHGFMVATLFIEFAGKEGIEYDVKIIDKILKHDILEVCTGDLIQPVKGLNQVTKDCWDKIEEEILNKNFELLPYSDLKLDFPPRIHSLFKICDYIDLLIFCLEEHDLGNQTAAMKNVIKNCQKLIWKELDNHMFSSVVSYLSTLNLNSYQ